MDGQVKNNSLYKFSIIIPTYNVEKYVQACLASIVNQTFQDLEIIIVNDGSTDNSIHVIENYLSDKTVSIKILTQKNAGLSAARNTGIKEVEGEYVIFLDSDDTLELNSLELLNHAISLYPAEDFDYICFTRKQISETGIETNTVLVNYTFSEDDKILKREDVIHNALRFENISCSVTDKTFKSSFLRRFSRNDVFVPGRYYEDHLFMMDVLQSTNNVLVTKHKLYRYLIREGSIMRTANVKIADDYHFLIVNLWKKKNNLLTNQQTIEQVIENHILVQITTFFQTLKNSKIQDERDYTKIVKRFKLLLAEDKLDVILLSKFNSLPKVILSKYFRSSFSNHLLFNNLFFKIFDFMIIFKRKDR